MNNVWETKALVKMNKSDEAKKLLDRLAAICAPVMGRRNWRVKCLKEFYPTNVGLLGMNVNRGVSICIRLRPGHDKGSFLPWADLLGTMVHELTHMAVGPHSAEFYKMMDEVYDEVEKSAGAAGTEKQSIAAALFLTKSQRLGGGSVVLGAGSAKAACDAAEKRKKNATLSASSGQRLGGSAVALSALTPAGRRKLAADAAERRLKDDMWCNNAGTLDDYDEADEVADAAPIAKILPKVKDNKSSAKSSSSSSSTKHNGVDLYLTWMCQNCDTVNDSKRRECLFCGTFREPEGSSSSSSSSSSASVSNEQNGKRRQPSSSQASSSSSTSSSSISSEGLLCPPCSSTGQKRGRSNHQPSSASSSSSSAAAAAKCTLIDLVDSDSDGDPPNPPRPALMSEDVMSSDDDVVIIGRHR